MWVSVYIYYIYFLTQDICTYVSMNWRQLALELADLKLAKTAGESQGQLWCKTIERFSKPSNKGQHRVGGGGVRDRALTHREFPCTIPPFSSRGHFYAESWQKKIPGSVKYLNVTLL